MSSAQWPHRASTYHNGQCRLYAEHCYHCRKLYWTTLLSLLKSSGLLWRKGPKLKEPRSRHFSQDNIWKRLLNIIHFLATKATWEKYNSHFIRRGNQSHATIPLWNHIWHTDLLFHSLLYINPLECNLKQSTSLIFEPNSGKPLMEATGLKLSLHLTRRFVLFLLTFF